jgi:hypothetical protein
MEPTCDWRDLMEATEPPPARLELGIIIKIVGQTKVTTHLLKLWCSLLEKANKTTSVRILKYRGLMRPNQLPLRDQYIYKYITQWLPKDRDLRTVYNMFTGGSGSTSGRTIDTLVTRFTKLNESSYYLDLTDNDIKIVSGYETGRNIIIFDINASYKSKLQQFSKTYFDCFKRGNTVAHQMKDGSVLPISLCQFTFYVWAKNFKILDFLDTQSDVHNPQLTTQKRSCRLNHISRKHHHGVNKSALCRLVSTTGCFEPPRTTRSSLQPFLK